MWLCILFVDISIIIVAMQRLLNLGISGNYLPKCQRVRSPFVNDDIVSEYHIYVIIFYPRYNFRMQLCGFVIPELNEHLW